jgi:hypothetical protein
MTSPAFTLDALPRLCLSDLAWFEGEDAGEGTGLGCNHDYRDLRDMRPADLRRVFVRRRR